MKKSNIKDQKKENRIMGIEIRKSGIES
jgi:hypothetical protein